MICVMQSMSASTTLNTNTNVLTNTRIQQLLANTLRTTTIWKPPATYQQLFHFKEVQRKTGLSDLLNVFHKEDKAMLEHTIRLHTRKTIYLIRDFLHGSFTFYHLIWYILRKQNQMTDMKKDYGYHLITIVQFCIM